LSSPKRHHLITLEGQSLKTVTLKERNKVNKADHMRTMRVLRALSRRSNLSKDFTKLTENLMIRKSAEGVDKSIGEDTSHSSGSYTSKRKYYILNIDNTNKDDEVAVATYKSRSSNLANNTLERGPSVLKD